MTARRQRFENGVQNNGLLCCVCVYTPQTPKVGNCTPYWKIVCTYFSTSFQNVLWVLPRDPVCQCIHHGSRDTGQPTPKNRTRNSNVKNSPGPILLWGRDIVPRPTPHLCPANLGYKLQPCLCPWRYIILPFKNLYFSLAQFISRPRRLRGNNESRIFEISRYLVLHVQQAKTPKIKAPK